MVKVNPDACIGCGLCVSICEKKSVFVMNDDGKAEVKNNCDCPCIKDAIESCPVNAIEE